MTPSLSRLLLFVGGSIELSILVKATLAVTAGLLTARVARRGRASTRHVILAATFAALLALPLAAILAPSVGFAVPISAPAQTIAAPSPMSQPATWRVTPAAIGSRSSAAVGRWWLPTVPIVRTAWLGGTMLLVLWLVSAVWQFNRLRRRGLPWAAAHRIVTDATASAGIRRPVEVRLHEELTAPVTCGWSRPTVLLPSDAAHWTDGDLRRALVHEIEHVRRGDWAVYLAARVACAVFWFHPLVWIALRQLCLEAERTCDDAVLQNAEGTEYAEQLVQLARRMSSAPAAPVLAMASRSQLSTRITAILSSTQPRGRLGLMPSALAVVASVALAITVAQVRAVRAQDREPAGAPVRSADTGPVITGVFGGVVHTLTEAPPPPPPPPPGTAGPVSRQEWVAWARLKPNNGEPGAGPALSGRQRVNAALDRALFEAAWDGDIDGIRELLATGANVNAAIQGDGSPLIGAARRGRMPAVRLLLDQGANPDQIVEGDGSPLIMAAREGHADIVALLLDRGASIEQIAPGDENALIAASASGRLPVVRLLVARGANVNARVEVDVYSTNDRQAVRAVRTPLNMARREGHQDVARYLVSVGAQE